MVELVIGLMLFFIPHSINALAPQWRQSCLHRWGAKGWKMRHAGVSLLGFALIIWGYGQARASGVQLWLPPAGLKHANFLFTLVAFILLGAYCIPGNHMTARLRHPLTLATKVWAMGHLLAVGSLPAVVIFASFLVWSIVVFRAARQRDRVLGLVPERGHWLNTVLAVVLGLVLWVVVVMWAHGAVIGVRVLG